MTPEQAAALRAEFPPALIGKLPKAGLMLDYVGHAATTDRLLQVDPDWTWEPMLDPAGAPIFQDGGLWIRLTICGVTRPGWGDGKNVKEMIGDAHADSAAPVAAKEKPGQISEKKTETGTSAPPETDALMARLVALSLEYKVLVPDFDVTVIRTKATEQIGKPDYKTWLEKQIKLLEGHIREKQPSTFEVPAGAKAA